MYHYKYIQIIQNNDKINKVREILLKKLKYVTSCDIFPEVSLGSYKPKYNVYFNNL